jgi:hypothetical protein
MHLYKYITSTTAIAAILACCCLAACKKSSNTTPSGKKVKGGYYSIQQYARDQFKMNKGIPYGFNKIVTHNGKKDTVVQNIYTVDWPFIFSKFFETDISDKKFLGHYNFSMFDDSATQTRNYFYEAKEDYLPTRKLMIMADLSTQMVKSIYIEYEKKSLLKFESRKLFYIPKKVIQIQEFNKALFRNPEETMTEYDFM